MSAPNQEKKKRKKRKKPKPKSKEQLRMEDLKDTFDMFDKDGDGAVTQKELREVFAFLNLFPTDVELQDLIDEFDKLKAIKSGSIYFDDFVEFMNRSAEGVSLEDEMTMAFKNIDVCNKGFIEAKDLKRFLFSTGDTVTDEDIQAIIKDADVDGSGSINYNEFVKLLFNYL